MMEATGIQVFSEPI